MKIDNPNVVNTQDFEEMKSKMSTDLKQIKIMLVITFILSLIALLT